MKDGLVHLFPIALVDGTQLEREKKWNQLPFSLSNHTILNNLNDQPLVTEQKHECIIPNVKYDVDSEHCLLIPH